MSVDMAGIAQDQPDTWRVPPLLGYLVIRKKLRSYGHLPSQPKNGGPRGRTYSFRTVRPPFAGRVMTTNLAMLEHTATGPAASARSWGDSLELCRVGV